MYHNSCFVTKKQIYSRKEARRMAKWHEGQECDRCRSGWYFWEEYPCHAGRHWHLGHRYVTHAVAAR